MGVKMRVFSILYYHTTLVVWPELALLLACHNTDKFCRQIEITPVNLSSFFFSLEYPTQPLRSFPFLSF